jgi:omega-amidase
VQDLTITTLQADLKWEDPAANRKMIDGLVSEMQDDTDLLILPEMFTTGFSMNTGELAEPMNGDSITWMRALAADRNMAVCGSLMVEESGQFYNRLIWMPPDGKLVSYDKRHLFQMGGESENYQPGQERKIIQLGDWRILPLICYDLRFPVWSRGFNEFDLIIYVASWPASRQSSWDILLPARAVENQCYVAGVNRLGTDGNNVNHTGGSVVLDFLGRIVKCAGIDTGTFTTTLSLRTLSRYRDKFRAWQDGDRFTLNT